MTRHRTWRILVLPLLLLLLAGACGDDDDSSSDASGEDATESTEANSGAVKLTGTVNASGATFPQPYYEDAIAAFTEENPGATINYAGGGSGKGRKDLATGVVDFAGSDGLVKPEDGVTKPFLYFPTVSAPITVSYHLTGVDGLQLSPATIAKIFSRTIKTWNDAAIKADNPDAKLPATPITVAHRVDGSGTTENFTKFLKAAAPDVWKLDAGSTVAWPADTQGGTGNPGVSQIVKDKEGGIGYVDLSDATATGLQLAKVKNKAGTFVSPTLEAASAALANATVNPDLTYSPLWTDGADAYPITAPTWLLVYTDQTDKAKGEIIKAFLTFVLNDGQDLAADASYAKLPDTLRDKAIAQIETIKLPA